MTTAIFLSTTGAERAVNTLKPLGGVSHVFYRPVVKRGECKGYSVYVAMEGCKPQALTDNMVETLNL